MLKSMTSNKYIKVLAFMVIVPLLFIALSYSINFLFSIGQQIGTYLACL